MAKSPTIKQRRAAKAIIENMQSSNPLPNGQILENVGYGKIIQDPKRVIEATGFKQAIRDLGLTEELITTSLVDDIKAKPKDRLGELRLGAEVLGMKNDDEKPKEKPSNVYNFFFSKEIQEEVKTLEDKIKEKLSQKNVQEN